MDSIPVVCLTGQVPTHLIGNDAFQEADTTGITRPATKHNYLVKRAEDLARVVHEAFYVARSGRPGPVVIDLPKDIVIGKAPYAAPPPSRIRSYRPQTEPDPGQIAKAVALLKPAKRPMVYTGGGVINAGPAASAALAQFVRMTGLPITNTLMGLGAYPAARSAVPRHAGHARHLRGQPRDAWLRRDAEHRRAVRRPGDRAAERVQPGVEEDPRRHRPVRRSTRTCRSMSPIVGDAGRVLDALIAAWKADSDRAATRQALADWWRQIDAWRAKDSLKFTQDMTPGAIIKPQYAIQRLYEMTRSRSRRRSSSPPRSASTRCGRRSTSTSSSRTTG